MDPHTRLPGYTCSTMLGVTQVILFAVLTKRQAERRRRNIWGVENSLQSS